MAECRTIIIPTDITVAKSLVGQKFYTNVHPLELQDLSISTGSVEHVQRTLINHLVLRDNAEQIIQECQKRLDELNQLAELLSTIPADVWFYIFTLINKDMRTLDAISKTCSTWRRIVRAHYQKLYPPPWQPLVKEWENWYVGSVDCTNPNRVFTTEIPFDMRHLFGTHTNLFPSLCRIGISTKMLDDIKRKIWSYEIFWKRTIFEGTMQFTERLYSALKYSPGKWELFVIGIRFILTPKFNFGHAQCIGVAFRMPKYDECNTIEDQLKLCGIGRMEVSLSDHKIVVVVEFDL